MSLRNNHNPGVSYGSMLLSILLAAGCSTSDTRQQPGVRVFVPQEQVTVAGELGERIDLVQQRLLCDTPFSEQLVLEDIARTSGYDRRFEQFEGDISGRWIGALSLLSRLTGERWGKHEQLVKKALALQQPGGWFGENHSDNPWDGTNSRQSWGPQIFGHGRLLLGLVDYYRATGDVQVLQAARTLADYLKNTFPLWQPENRDDPWWGNFSCAIEAVMALHSVTGDDALLDQAAHIAKTVSDFGRYHSHTYLSALIGLLHLYRETGDRVYLEQVLRDYWENIYPVSKDVDGAMPEWFPAGMRTEGCSLTDWFKLNIELWRTTGRSLYLDTAEEVMLNGLYYHQCYSGYFGHTTRTANLRGYVSNFDQAWWCCTMHGAQALGIAAGAIYARHEDCVYVNLYTTSSAVVNLNNRVIKIDQETRYPQSGRITVTVTPETDGYCSLALRIPGWSRLSSLSVNNRPAEGRIEDGFARIPMKGAGPFIIQLDLAMPFRIVAGHHADLWEHGYMPRAYKEIRGVGALYYGPLLLVQDGFYGDVSNDPLSVADVSSEERFSLEPASPDSRTCRLPEAHFLAPRTDGKGTVTLSPISEATWHQPYRDDMPGFEKNSGMPVELWPVIMQHEWTLSPTSP